MSLPRSLLAGLAVLAVLALFPVQPAVSHAQTAPFTAYGVGLKANQVVAAYVRNTLCGTTAASAAGDWLLAIAAEAPCKPKHGDTISFRLDGRLTTATERWRLGGAPANVASGIALVLPPDTKPPVVKAPASITVYVASASELVATPTEPRIAAFLAGATAVDDVDGAVTVTHDGPAIYRGGATTVTFRATDTAGNVGTASATVTVLERSRDDLSGLVEEFTKGRESMRAYVFKNAAGWPELTDALVGQFINMVTFKEGKPFTYVAGAPDFVNSSFALLFRDGRIPEGEIVWLVKR